MSAGEEKPHLRQASVHRLKKPEGAHPAPSRDRRFLWVCSAGGARPGIGEPGIAGVRAPYRSSHALVARGLSFCARGAASRNDPGSRAVASGCTCIEASAARATDSRPALCERLSDARARTRVGQPDSTPKANPAGIPLGHRLAHRLRSGAGITFGPKSHP